MTNMNDEANEPHKEAVSLKSSKHDAAIIAAVIGAVATIAAAVCTPLISNWIKDGAGKPTGNSEDAAGLASKAAGNHGGDGAGYGGGNVSATTAPVETDSAGTPPEGKTLAPPGNQIMAEGEPVAGGSDMRFPFKGRANTPLFFRISGEGDRLRLTAAALDELEKTLTTSRTIGLGANKEGMAFTPLKDGQYILQVKALSGSGRIKVVMEEIAPPPAQRGMGRPLPLDTPKTGRLANGAYDTFTFHAEAREAMTFLYKSDPIYKCDAEMVLPDGQNKRLASFTNRTPPMTASFIAPNAGTYTLKLTATRLYGNYEITRKPMR